MSQPFDDRDGSDWNPPVWDGQVPGSPDNDGTTPSGNTAVDQRD